MLYLLCVAARHTSIAHIDIRRICVLALVLRRVKANIDFIPRKGYTVNPLPHITPRIFDSPILASVVSVRIASGISFLVIRVPRPGGSLYIVGMPRLKRRRVSVRPASHNGLTIRSRKLNEEQLIDPSGLKAFSRLNFLMRDALFDSEAFFRT